MLSLKEMFYFVLSGLEAVVLILLIFISQFNFFILASGFYLSMYFSDIEWKLESFDFLYMSWELGCFDPLM